jgi:hypothetical protein
VELRGLRDAGLGRDVRDLSPSRTSTRLVDVLVSVILRRRSRSEVHARVDERPQIRIVVGHQHSAVGTGHGRAAGRTPSRYVVRPCAPRTRQEAPSRSSSRPVPWPAHRQSTTNALRSRRSQRPQPTPMRRCQRTRVAVAVSSLARGCARSSGRAIRSLT